MIPLSKTEHLRTLVRPLITLVLVGAWVYAALANLQEAVKVLGPATTGILGFWFGERGQVRKNGLGSGNN